MISELRSVNGGSYRCAMQALTESDLGCLVEAVMRSSLHSKQLRVFQRQSRAIRLPMSVVQCNIAEANTCGFETKVITMMDVMWTFRCVATTSNFTCCATDRVCFDIAPDVAKRSITVA
ncbi:hypothetical protein TNCV_1830801 [Trichonephila clavipes]|nr:hypothetical protein TNCV_1830801 [Trichonephila clavipes]